MSKGPGRVERAVEALFNAKPDDAFTTDELCRRVYRVAKGRQPSRAQTVATIRAAKKACACMPDWQFWRSERRGGPLVFLNRANVMSYAIGRKKADMYSWTTESIRVDLAPRGRDYRRIAKGGVWWRFVQLYIADRDGDTSKRANKLREEHDAARAGYDLPPDYPQLSGA